MRLGLSSFTYPWAVGVPGHPPPAPLSAFDLVDRTAASGLDLVQFGDNLPLHQSLPDDLDRLRQHLQAHGVDAELGTRGIGEHLHRYAEIADLLGAPFVRLVVDDGADQPSSDQARRRLAAFEPAFRSRGLRLAIENHDRFGSDELATLVTGLGDWVGVCLDTANSLAALEPPAQVVGTLAPLTINLHVKDFTIRRLGHALGFEVVGAPAGQGRLDIPGLLDALAASPARTAILEQWPPRAETLAATIATETAWAEASLAYLRTQPGLHAGRAAD